MKQPALRQNDFGGTLGGPVEIPHVYNGKDKTFFFVSYEGLRLTAPQAATINYVPDALLRSTAPYGLSTRSECLSLCRTDPMMGKRDCRIHWELVQPGFAQLHKRSV